MKKFPDVGVAAEANVGVDPKADVDVETETCA